MASKEIKNLMENWRFYVKETLQKEAEETTPGQVIKVFDYDGTLVSRPSDTSINVWYQSILNVSGTKKLNKRLPPVALPLAKEITSKDYIVTTLKLSPQFAADPAGYIKNVLLAKTPPDPLLVAVLKELLKVSEGESRTVDIGNLKELERLQNEFKTASEEDKAAKAKEFSDQVARCAKTVIYTGERSLSSKLGTIEEIRAESINETLKELTSVALPIDHIKIAGNRSENSKAVKVTEIVNQHKSASFEFYDNDLAAVKMMMNAALAAKIDKSRVKGFLVEGGNKKEVTVAAMG
jgi:hypothetical protein